MLKALIIYDTFSGHTRKIAEKLKAHLESYELKVDLFRDKAFTAFDTVAGYDVIALGTPSHGNRPAAMLTKKLQPLLKMNLSGKKLITFASGTQVVTKEIETYMAGTKIALLASIPCRGVPPEDLEKVFASNITKEKLF